MSAVKPTTSVGVMPYRLSDGELEVFICKPSGPFFFAQNAGIWGIAKGHIESTDVDELSCAIREFEEEIGYKLPTDSDYTPLASVRNNYKKTIKCFAVECPEAVFVESNTFSMEYPFLSGEIMEFPEISDGKWVGRDEYMYLINKHQTPFFDEMKAKLDA